MKLVLGMEVGLSPGDFVLDGDPVAPSPKGGADPQNFRPMFIVTKTARWMNMILGMVVGLSPGEFVLDEDPAPSPKRGRAPYPVGLEMAEI